jgi:hypothetical protein
LSGFLTSSRVTATCYPSDLGVGATALCSSGGDYDHKTHLLRSLCVNTGADRDPNPEMVLADLDTSARESAPTHSIQAGPCDKAKYKTLPNRIRDQLERSAPDFTVKFSEDKNGFYLNDRRFAQDDEPMTRAKVGTYAHWRGYERNKRDSSVSHPSGAFSCLRAGGSVPAQA